MIATKSIVLIVDGMGDLPSPALHGKTPLEAAFTPNLDRLTASGCYGQVDPIAPGITPNTDSGTGMMMGMQPEHGEWLRRGPVEAAGAGCKLREGDVAMRANFASVSSSDGRLMVTDRRAGRVERDVPDLLAALSSIKALGDIELQLRATDGHRAVLVMSGENLDAAVSDTDPGDEILPAPLLRARALHPQAQHTAHTLNQFLQSVHQVLHPHDLNRHRMLRGKVPANALITRGAGAAKTIGNIIPQAGLSAAVVSGCNTVRGLGRMFGFAVVQDRRFTAKRNTDIDAKIQAAITALEQHDMVFVHIKAPDLFAHDREPHGKKDVLERFDVALAPLMNQDLIIACAADHSTDSNTGKHTADPVPALLYTPGRGMKVNGTKFGESACRNGNMARQSSNAFLQRVLELMRGT